ncbi:helix-turn-helix domain-containing protein [Proteiniclasticum sp. BAD-10]|uniref:Helix-turn-helix domain-containing protein n=1 Tax=Proteiniclasticum sediminis TaxID=2804028 RepID=A0A941HQG5_9CLOT|nr:AraC family transcriptional regulator [Proteiniclasticum sediminis]MBR0576416.1 helix-turn-helix domain-containing protein [Proteiniclasticum sediminis]
MGKRGNEYSTRQYMNRSDYELFYYKSTKLRNVSLHHHDFFEVYFFVKGEVSYQIEGRNYQLIPGDIVLVNHKELHQAMIEGADHYYERYVLWVSRPYLKRLSTPQTDLTRCFLDKRKKTLLRTSIDNQQLVRSILDKLIAVEGYKGTGQDLLPDLYITELMVALNRISFDVEEKLQPVVKKNQLIDAVIHYLNENLDGEINMDELSRHFFISKYHLSREFKKHTGTTLYRYVVQKRLILAKGLILQGNPITAVYEQCGFGDYSNFFRAFKNEYGTTPKEFLQVMQEGQKKAAELEAGL